MYAATKSIQSCPTLCDPIDGSPPGSTVPGILQARTLEWVAISFYRHIIMTIKILAGFFFRNSKKDEEMSTNNKLNLKKEMR